MRASQPLLPLLFLTALAWSACGSSERVRSACEATLPRAQPLVDPDNLLSNPSFEEADATGLAPAGWSTSSWGELEARFSYLNEGQDGARAVGIRIERYDHGDAKWLCAHVPVTAMRYVYSERYRSSVASKLVASYLAADGSERFETLAELPASGDWSLAQAMVEPPEGTLQLRVMHVLAAVGSLELDNASLRAHSAPRFRRALVSITFDDGYRSDHSVALPLLRARGMVATHYISTGLLGARNRLSWSLLEELKAHGHQLAAHTIAHPDLTTLSPDALLEELEEPPRLLAERCLGDGLDFASPFSAYDMPTLTAIRARYRSHRTTNAGVNPRRGFDPYQLKAYSMRASTSADQVREWLGQAEAQQAWVLLVYHALDAAGGEYAVSPETFEAHLEEVRQSGLPVVTVEAALQELQPQFAPGE